MEVLNELGLFAGIGGGILGLSPHCRTICAVENGAYPTAVLVSRQNDGQLPPFPIWDDIRSFDGTPWRGVVDIVSGGFPCQDISVAGTGAGLAGSRSGLWFEMLRIIGEVEPRFVFIENSPCLRGRGLGTVLEGLASLGFDAEWTCISAAEVGAPHKRDRMWILAAHLAKMADPSKPFSDTSVEQMGISGQSWKYEQVDAPNAAGDRRDKGWDDNRIGQETWRSPGWWAAEPDVGRVVYGLPYRVDRIKGLGNAQVPLCALIAFEHLMGRLTTTEEA